MLSGLLSAIDKGRSDPFRVINRPDLIREINKWRPAADPSSVVNRGRHDPLSTIALGAT